MKTQWNSLLVLPMSNAEVERIFSQMNVVKNKTRNQLSLNMTNSILCLRSGLKRSGKCCHDYNLPKKAVKAIGTTQAYPKNYENFELHNLLLMEYYLLYNIWNMTYFYNLF